MRFAVRVLLFLSFSFWCAGSDGVAYSATNRVILAEANLNSPPIQKLSSSTLETSLGFRMAGIQSADVATTAGNFQSVSPLSDSTQRFGETGEDGMPDLPVISQLVGIPDQAGVRVEILSSSYQILDNYDIMPSQPSSKEGSPDTLPFIKNEEFYQRNEFYPADIVQLGEPIICRDLRMIQTVVNPVQYNPVTKQLKVYTSIDYRLVYEGTDTRNQKIRRDNHISETFLPLYRSIIPNADEMLADYEPIKGGYLIITPDAFADTIKALARWKHLKGYSVVIAKATDINSGGSPTHDQVFSYIQNAYNNWANPPEFVCIVGDYDSGIPDFPYNDYYASDHAYSCVDGSDYLSDVFVTRMSISTMSQLRVAMRKALIYEKTPFMGDPNYWLRGLSVAGNVYAVTPRLTTLWVRSQLLNHGFTRVDTSFSWSSGQSDPNLLGYFNSGVSLISYRGWAGPSGWYSPYFQVGDLDQIQTNNKIGVMASLVCGTGEFHTAECFGEKWIRMGTLPSALKGGPCFYGVSDTDTHTKWNNPIMIGYYWAILEDAITNFSAAAFMGKLELYNTYPRHNYVGGYVEQYFHTYNTLGDPELEVRTAVPQNMTVTYPSTIPTGTSLLNVHVVGSIGSPLENAYVNLVKGYAPNEQVFVGGKTNANGDIVLNFNAATADTMFVTVTARNYIPHAGFTMVQSQAIALNSSAIAIDDDNSGNSSGNSDGNINPSETIEFGITLQNFGNSLTATGVSSTLTSPDPRVIVTLPTQNYPDMTPGATANSGKFAAHIASDIPQGEHIILQLNITANEGSWTAAVPVDIKSMTFSVNNVTYPGNSNNRLDPSETSQLVVTLQNHGELGGTLIAGELSTSDTSVTIIDNSADFGDIGVGSTGSNVASPFVVEVRTQVYRGHNVNFNLRMTSSNGSVANKVFSVVIGNVSTTDPLGPDSYGYYLYDNTDITYLPAPIYNWQEINSNSGGQGTRINFPLSTDDDAVVVNLPFNFIYYGQSLNYMLVAINGFVAFDTSRYDMQGHRWANFDNNQIPEAGAPRGLIAPFWDDLKYDASGINGVYTFNDVANHRYIIEWSACYHPQSPGNSPETFEMIIYNPTYYPTPTGDAEIVFQYNTVYNNDTDDWDTQAPGLYSSVGMQNLSNCDGLQYTYDNLYNPAAAVLQAGRAIKITTATGLQQPPHLSYDPTSFLVSSQPGQIAHDTLNISNQSGGLLNFTLSEFADNGRLAVSKPVSVRPQPIGQTLPELSKSGTESEPIYPPSLLNHGGPDAYGNTWIDSDDPGGPTYGWIDISAVGTLIQYTDDDDYFGPISLGSSISFFGNSYNSIYVSANGILSFGAGTTSWENADIPNPATPNNFVAPLWDDLSPQRTGATVYYYNDTANNRFIVSYNNVPFYSGGGNLTFEAIIYANGRMLFEYGTVDGGTRGLNQLTIGVEDSQGTDGLEIVYNSDYLHSNMAIIVSPPNHWLSANIHGGYLLAGQDTSAIVTFDATELPSGVYTGHIEIDSNDPLIPSANVPLTFNVSGQGVPDMSFTPPSITDTLTQPQSSQVNLIIRNRGGAELRVSLSATENNMALNNWLFISPAADTIAVGDSLIATVTLNSNIVAPGIHSGQISILSNDPDTPTAGIPVTLRIVSSGIPNISYSPSAIADTVIEGQTALMNFVVHNIGTADLRVFLNAVENNIDCGPEIAKVGQYQQMGKETISSGGDEQPHVLNTWFFINPSADTLGGGDSLIVTVTLNAGFVGAGIYNGVLNITSNDPDTPAATVPVTFTVQPQGGQGCAYILGDINENGTPDAIDVTFGVNYLKGRATPTVDCSTPCPGHGAPFYASGDVNGSCEFNGIDITFFVNYLKGRVASMLSCPDCPPSTVLGKHNNDDRNSKLDTSK